jgi:hypothetical protein
MELGLNKVAEEKRGIEIFVDWLVGRDLAAEFIGDYCPLYHFLFRVLYSSVVNPSTNSLIIP